MSHPVKIRPLTLPESMVDELYFLAKREGLLPQKLVVRLIQAELNKDTDKRSRSDLNVYSAPVVKFFAKLPPELDGELERASSKAGCSPNQLIFQALTEALRRAQLA